jgi:uncharacterized protein with PQ loop repeat
MTTELKKSKSVFEKFMLVFAIAEPLATIPQIYQVWSKHSVAGVSLLTWAFYTVTSAVWLVYGLKIRDKPIIVSGFLWAGTQALVVIGILINRT